MTANLIPNRPGERRGGRQKGAPNKLTKALKEMILGALDEAGGEAYLVRQAKDNPGAFLTLLGKIVPSELVAKVTTFEDVSDTPETPFETLTALKAIAAQNGVVLG